MTPRMSLGICCPGGGFDSAMFGIHVPSKRVGDEPGDAAQAASKLTNTAPLGLHTTVRMTPHPVSNIALACEVHGERERNESQVEADSGVAGTTGPVFV